MNKLLLDKCSCLVDENLLKHEGLEGGKSQMSFLAVKTNHEGIGLEEECPGLVSVLPPTAWPHAVTACEGLRPLSLS